MEHSNVTGRELKNKVLGDWSRIVERLGIATVVAGSLMLGGYKSVCWMGEHVFGPMADEYQEMQKETRLSIKAGILATQLNSESQSKMADAMTTMADSNAKAQESHASMAKSFGVIADGMKRIDENSLQIEQLQKRQQQMESAVEKP